jgi:hypothetical protein
LLYGSCYVNVCKNVGRATPLKNWIMKGHKISSLEHRHSAMDGRASPIKKQNAREELKHEYYPSIAGPGMQLLLIRNFRSQLPPKAKN